MLPMILQHVRELAEVHTAGAERQRYKIITPFPPNTPDFPDFAEDALTFGDPPVDGDSASLDTVRAWEFFKRTDPLYYDYSYGIQSDYTLSDICQRFFLNAKTESGDLHFTTSFEDRKAAFLRKYLRSTAGDLGHFEFRYTTLSPIAWNAEHVVLASSEVERLKLKALQVYQELELESPGIVDALIEEVRASNLATIQYDFGFFDVVREWNDPRLFESAGWSFDSGSRVLYGDTDPFFTDDEVQLCFAQRFYLVRNCSATPHVAPPPPPPVVRDHRAAQDPRRRMRNTLIDRQLARVARLGTPMTTAIAMPSLMAAATTATTATTASTAATSPPPARAGFVWVPATGAVPGHWERERAGAPATPPAPAAPPRPQGYQVAAVKCRVVPRRP